MTQATLNFFSAIRVYQWSKNTLIFLPLFLSHSYLDLEKIYSSLIAFVAFSLCASATYLINDCLDYKTDKLHPSKQNRPIASGAISRKWASAISIIFFAAGFGLSLYHSPQLFALVTTYCIISSWYSLLLKKIVLVDVFILAFFYTFRIVIGTIVSGADFSFWLLSFSIFFFLNLSFLKRYDELLALSDAHSSMPGRKYSKADQNFVSQVGLASAYVSVLIFALYINSANVLKLYKEPMYLIGLCPLLLYWVTRLWYLGHKKKISSDPLIFTLKDPASYIVLGLILIFLFLAL